MRTQGRGQWGLAGGSGRALQQTWHLRLDKSLIKVEGVRETPEAGEHWDGWCQAGMSWGGEWGSGVLFGARLSVWS